MVTTSVDILGGAETTRRLNHEAALLRRRLLMLELTGVPVNPALVARIKALPRVK